MNLYHSSGQRPLTAAEQAALNIEKPASQVFNPQLPGAPLLTVAEQAALAEQVALAKQAAPAVSTK